MSRGRFSIIAGLLGLLPAFAEIDAAVHPSAGWPACAQSDRQPDAGIAGCPSIIDAAREARPDPAIAYLNRGNAFYTRGDFDPAIADFKSTSTGRSSSIQTMPTRTTRAARPM